MCTSPVGARAAPKKIFLHELGHARGRWRMIGLGFEHLIAGGQIDGGDRRFLKTGNGNFLALYGQRDRIESMALIDAER